MAARKVLVFKSSATKPHQREFSDSNKYSKVWAIAGEGLDQEEANGQAGAMVETRPATLSTKA